MERHMFVRYVLCLRGWKNEFSDFPDALSAFAKQKTCSLSKNQKEGARRGAKGLAMGGSVKEAEQKIQVFQIIIIIQYLTSPPGLLFLLVRTWRGAVSPGALSSLLLEGGQRALICYSESKGTCWLRLALLTFVVQPRALADGLFLPEKPAAASNLHRW